MSGRSSIVIDRIEALGAEHRPETIRELQREIGAFARVVDGRLSGDVGEADRLGAASTHVFLPQCPVSEVLERRVLERMARPRGIEQVAGQHGVDAEPGQPHSVAFEHDCVELQVVPHLLDRRILEQRLEGGQRLVDAELRAVVHPPVAERQVACRPGPGRERQADDAGADRGGDIRQHPDTEPASSPQLVDERSKVAGRGHEPVVLLGRLGGRSVFHHERAEPQLVEQLVAALARRPAISERIDLERDRHVGVNPQQLPAGPRLVGMRQEGLTVFLLRHLGRAREQFIERAVGRDQSVGPFLADARHALHVVDGVAHQRQDVDDLIRRDAELLLDTRRVVPGALIARVEDTDAVADELKEVLVSGDDRDTVSFGAGAHGEGPDHVVGLVALVCHDGHAERFARAVHEGNLLGELVRHRRAVGLVVGGEVVAERPARQIERRGDVFGTVFLQQLAQHRHEDVDGVGGTASRVAEQRAFRGANRRVIRAVHLRAAVDEIEERGGEHQSGEIFTISLPMMRRVAALALATAFATACGSGGLFRQYEYEEEIYLSLDGTATVYVNSSVAALDALRGTSFDTNPSALPDRAGIRAFYSSPVTRVRGAVTTSRRSNRRFVHVRLDVDDVRRLGEARAAGVVRVRVQSRRWPVPLPPDRGSRRGKGRRQRGLDGPGDRCIPPAPAEQDQIHGTRGRRSSAATSWCGSKRSPIDATASRSRSR